MTRRIMLMASGAGLAALAVRAVVGGRAVAAEGFPVTHTEAEWQKLLTPAQFDILRHEGTEAPFSSPLDHVFAAGRYDCAACAQKLYSSATKFDSGTGWPSFYQPLPGGVATRDDSSLGMERTEVHCARCGGHLGHVFNDGPKPTGLRYCMNGAVLKFQAA